MKVVPVEEATIQYRLLHIGDPVNTFDPKPNPQEHKALPAVIVPPTTLVIVASRVVFDVSRIGWP